MTKASAAELLDLIVEHAPKLREAGIASVQLEAVSFELLPREPEAAVADDVVEDEAKPRSPLDDSDTFGGRRVPRVIRQESRL